MDWSKVIQQNPWWSNNEDISLLDINKAPYKIQRKKLDLQKGTIYLIKGPRRVGKTIYLKQIASSFSKDSLYINIDTFINLKPKELIRQIESFISIKKNPVILLDEIQNLKDGCLFLKSMIDLNILKNAVVIVTGSDPRTIDVCKQHLIGRSEEVNIMAPLTFRQFLLNYYNKNNKPLHKLLLKTQINLKEKNKILKQKYLLLEPHFKDIEKLFDIYLLTGGFPEAINSYFKNNSISRKYYEDIIEKIFEKLDKKKSIEILNVLSKAISNPLKYSTISQKTSYSIKTIKQYLFDFYELLLIFEIKENKKDILKKFYFKDPFIFHSILSYYDNLDPFVESTNRIFNEKIKGTLVENIVASNLHNLYFSNLKYFLSEDRKEIDFLVFDKAIEVKYRAGLVALNKLIKSKEYLLLTRTPVGPKDIEKENVLAIPVCVFLGLLSAPNNFM